MVYVPLVFLVVAPIVHAHGITAEVRHRGGQVHITAVFDNGDPAANATFRFSSAIDGQLDDRGTAVIGLPPAGEYQLRIDAGDGHLLTMMVTIAPPLAEDQRLTVPAESGVQWVRLLIGLTFIAAITLLTMKARR